MLQNFVSTKTFFHWWGKWNCSRGNENFLFSVSVLFFFLINLFTSWNVWLISWWTNIFLATTCCRVKKLSDHVVVIWMKFWIQLFWKNVILIEDCLFDILNHKTMLIFRASHYTVPGFQYFIHNGPLWQQSQTGFTLYRINLKRLFNVYSSL